MQFPFIGTKSQFVFCNFWYISDLVWSYELCLYYSVTDLALPPAQSIYIYIYLDLSLFYVLLFQPGKELTDKTKQGIV